MSKQLSILDLRVGMRAKTKSGDFGPFTVTRNPYYDQEMMCIDVKYDDEEVECWLGESRHSVVELVLVKTPKKVKRKKK